MTPVAAEAGHNSTWGQGAQGDMDASFNEDMEASFNGDMDEIYSSFVETTANNIPGSVVTSLSPLDVVMAVQRATQFMMPLAGQCLLFVSYLILFNVLTQ